MLLQELEKSCPNAMSYLKNSSISILCDNNYVSVGMENGFRQFSVHDILLIEEGLKTLK